MKNLQTITIDEIVALLPIVKNRGWRTGTNGEIRDREGRCPICALVREIDPASDFKLLAATSLETIGLHLSERTQFLYEADNATGHELRDEIKRALGIA